MSSVIVYGASGYIGRYVAYGLRNAGYRVYGVIRKPEFASILLQHEVLPVILPDIKNPTEEFKKAIDESISVVDASGINPALINYLTELNKNEKNSNFQHQYIGTSGSMAHEGAEFVVSERKRPSSSVPMLAERIKLEDLVFSENINGVVLRPGGIYGLDGNVKGMIPRLNEGGFLIGQNDELKICGQRDKMVSVVHITDLVAAYVLIVEKGLRGKVYDIASEAISYEQLRVAAAKASGWKGTVKYIDSNDIPPELFLEKLMDKSVRLVGTKLRTELGWNPKRIGLLHEMDIYYRAFIAQRDAATDAK